MDNPHSDAGFRSALLRAPRVYLLTSSSRDGGVKKHRVLLSSVEVLLPCVLCKDLMPVVGGGRTADIVEARPKNSSK